MPVWLWLRVGVVVLVRLREPEGGVEEVAVGVSEGGTLTEGRLVDAAVCDGEGVSVLVAVGTALVVPVAETLGVGVAVGVPLNEVLPLVVLLVDALGV